MTDLRQSVSFAAYMEKIGWDAAEYRAADCEWRIYIKKIPVLGNFVKIWRPDKIVSTAILDEIAKKYHAFAVQVNYSPTKTLKLDLTPSREDILGQTTKEARYEIRKAEKNKTIVKNSQNIEIFCQLWQENAWRRGFWLPFKKEIRSIYEAFGKNSFLLLGYLDSKPLAGALILVCGKTAYYFHAASTPLGRKMAAPSLLIWEAIKLAKNKGCRLFDFEGLYDERFPNRSWLGFTHFKQSFGGKVVTFPGTYTKVYQPLLQWLPGFAD